MLFTNHALKIPFLLFGIINCIIAECQIDNNSNWNLGVGIRFSSLREATAINTFSYGPVFTISHKTGFDLSYEPQLIIGNQGIYRHILTLGYEHFDNGNFDGMAEMSHIFSNSKQTEQYDAIKNEFYGFITYKKPFLSPILSTYLGFEGDSTEHWSKRINMVLGLGVTHGFSFQMIRNYFNVNFIPKVMLNMSNNKFIDGPSGLPSSNYSLSSAESLNTDVPEDENSTNTDLISHRNLKLSNVEIGIEGEIEFHAFSLRPEMYIFVPLKREINSLEKYWSINFIYHF
ncbi:MAG: hypothetical protein NVS1B13_25060 [Flavisolibacter sp.]